MIYVMSDIHGNSKAFHSVLEQIQLADNDTLYVLGDVIDRHPDGIEILMQLMKMPNVKMLLGNHEHMMLNAVNCNNDTEDLIEIRKIIECLKIWYNNGGRVTHHKFEELCENDRISIINFLHSLPLNLDIEVNGIKYKLIHGAPLENFPLYEKAYASETEYAVWHRWQQEDEIPDGYTLIFGHTPTRKFQDCNPLSVWYGENAIGIDCGSGFNNVLAGKFTGRLACLRLDDMREFYSEN